MSDSETDSLISRLVEKHKSTSKKAKSISKDVPRDEPDDEPNRNLDVSHQEDMFVMDFHPDEGRRNDVAPPLPPKPKRKATPKQLEHLAKARQVAAEKRKLNAEERKVSKVKSEKESRKEEILKEAHELLAKMQSKTKTDGGDIGFDREPDEKSRPQGLEARERSKSVTKPKSEPTVAPKIPRKRATTQKSAPSKRSYSPPHESPPSWVNQWSDYYG